MTREEYIRRADELIRAFAKVYDPAGPQHGHHSALAREASANITAWARNWQPEWIQKPGAS
jgi:hypothetical protein